MLHQNWFMDKRFEMFNEYGHTQWFYDTKTECFYIVSEMENGNINIVEHSGNDKNDVIYPQLMSEYEEWKRNNEIYKKEYYGADEIYISPKTNEIYTAYHFSDVKYLVMREREMDFEADDVGGPSVINWFIWDLGDETLYDVLKKYVDSFESMGWEDYMKEYNHI